MPKYLIEVPHDDDVEACAQVVECFLNYGSHFVVNADWGCKDGVHKAWITIETDTKEQARDILPPPHRAQAKIIELNKFSMEDIEDILKHHHKNK
jgi:nicotinate-nucleotide pyrophosphorylase